MRSFPFQAVGSGRRTSVNVKEESFVSGKAQFVATISRTSRAKNAVERSTIVFQSAPRRPTRASLLNGRREDHRVDQWLNTIYSHFLITSSPIHCARVCVLAKYAQVKVNNWTVISFSAILQLFLDFLFSRLMERATEKLQSWHSSSGAFWKSKKREFFFHWRNFMELLVFLDLKLISLLREEWKSYLLLFDFCISMFCKVYS